MRAEVRPPAPASVPELLSGDHMPIDRDTHARIAKKIINHDAYGIPLLCMWDDCERSATSIYRFRACRHPVGWACAYADRVALAHGSQGAHIWMAFCSERHAVYFRYSEGWRALAMIDQQGRAYGNLPTGSKGMS